MKLGERVGVEPTELLHPTVFKTVAFPFCHLSKLEEGTGIEPVELLRPHAFQTCALDHSANPPNMEEEARFERAGLIDQLFSRPSP